MADGHYGPVAANLPKDQLGVSSAGTEKGGGAWGTVTAARATGASAKSVHEEQCSYFCLVFFFLLWR